MNVSKDLGYWIREFLTGTRHITSHTSQALAMSKRILTIEEP